ncbi:peptidase M20 domain-containing protein 2 isoform X2 [Falco naumanni]|uniref:peptidase M20 domain-containing protein 2 isoform X2 n=1 Tax=Falco naumanni TaxID=148594 RepID=UPI001ADEAD4F|nr:peptidase M20 domain-containing protein 2 isoform X2 [Falco naumanni]
MRPQEPPQGGPAAALETLKQRACESVELNAARLGALSRDIWSRPELAYEEHQAHDAMTRFFSSAELPGAAWAVQPRYKLGTAFRAEWGTAAPRGPSPRPLRLAFLCEYDALPGIGHACGHNLIAEVGAGAALALKAALESLPPPAPAAVQVTVLGTPAEEQGGGKIELIKAGAFDGLDVVFMAHPSQENAAYLPDVAEHDVTVKYYGKASHAAAYPWEGVNALDAAVLAYNNLSVLRQQMKPTWRVHGVIKNGGVKPNIIPSYTELEFYLRAPSMKDLSVLTEKVENCFRSAALATGCKVEIKGGVNDYYNVLPNKSLQKVYKENGQKLGIEFVAEDCILNGLSGNSMLLTLVHEFSRLVFQRAAIQVGVHFCLNCVSNCGTFLVCQHYSNRNVNS